jgi:hypothetical protein
MGKKVILPGVQPGRYTEQELENAAKDAGMLVGDCKAIAVCMAADIASRRLYMVARGQMDAILEEGWEITNLPLVTQYLVMSAQERAARTKFTVAELRRNLVEDVLPFLDLLVAQERTITPPEAPPEEDQTNVQLESGTSP